MMRRRTFLAGAGVAFSAPHLARAQSAKVLRFVPQADLTILDPIWTTAYVTRNHGLAIFDTLYGLDSQFKPQPQMVAGHTTDPDGKVWTLTLRDGLVFHDGQPVLARDCVASIRRWGTRDSFGQTLLAVTDELSAPDDKTIRFRLKQPFPLLPNALGKAASNICAIMPERLARTDPFKQITEMVGSGPYRFLKDERVLGARTVYAKFDRYHPRESGTADFTSGPKIAHFDRLEWTIIPDASTAASALQLGEVDWWENPSFDLLPMLRQDSRVSVRLQDPLGYIGTMRFNHLQAPFNNPELRRIILRAVRQDDFLQAVAGDDRASWRDNVGAFCPGTAMANDAGLAMWKGPVDFDKLRKDVVASGYKGERVALPIANDFPILKAFGDVGADLLKKAGLNVDVQATDFGAVLGRLAKTDAVDKGGWSVFHTYWAGLDETTPATHPVLRGNGLAGNRGWPTSPVIEQLRAEWLNATTEAEQKRLAVALQEQAWIDVPYIPLGQLVPPAVYSRSLVDMLPGFSLFWNVRRA